MKTQAPSSSTFAQSPSAVTSPQDVITTTATAATLAAHHHSPSATSTTPVDPNGKPNSQRPPLQRRNDNPSPSPATIAQSGRPPMPSFPADDTTTTEESDLGSTDAVTTDEDEGSGDERSSGSPQADREAPPRRTPEEIEIERLRQAVCAKMLQNQQRVKLSPKASPEAISPGIGARRIFPIKEESSAGTVSPLNAAFSSPLATGHHTASTESTGSATTIRGSVPATTGSAMPVRTPSYPFPYVPGTPKTWSSAFHQPFTALSPTATSTTARYATPPWDQIASGESTPAASTATFLPAGSRPGLDDDQYPSPNLYDVVLLLNSEPGLDAWWSTVVRIMNQWFGAERAALAVPADASDLENVPWGQKCTFDAAGPPRTQSEQKKREQSTPASKRSDKGDAPDKSRETGSNAPSTVKGKRRPNLEARHSFAGHEQQRNNLDVGAGARGAPLERPRGPLRTASHAPHLATRGEHPLRQVAPLGHDGALYLSPRRESTFSDPEFSNISDQPEGPYAAVFPILRALDSEPDALIDSTGINRILERGKLVTLTRDYTAGASSLPKSSPRKDQQEATASPQESRRQGGRPRGGKSSKGSRDERGYSKLTTHYEEYEQLPSSPWSQSPAPSPAIKPDLSENPFFSGANVDEESFNPTSSTQDYSKTGCVEAIGIDAASTIIHIPLIHPILSQPMQPIEPDTPAEEDDRGRKASTGRSSVVPSERTTFERRAPIAILSILSSAVPFPKHWISCLKLLGPHLATSFSNAHQFTAAIRQASYVRPERYALSNPTSFTLVSDDTQSLQDLMKLDIDNITDSAPGSMTSPSDYSGRSRPSPGGSLGGTPSWDPTNLGFSSKHSVGSTPAHLSGTEMIDSYFDAKKKMGKTSAAPTTSHPLHAGKSSPTPIENWPLRKVASPTSQEESETPTPVGAPKPPAKPPSRDEASGGNGRDSSPPRPVPGSVPRKFSFRYNQPNETTRRPHSFLHSYGADFASTFQSLPAPTMQTPRTPGIPAPTRSGSMAESDMPPPSERLLRTIIDSLPVQIFTAAPGTGVLTWVNSKFLVYRGQDSRQVLQEPWEAIHPDDRDEYMTMWQKSLKRGQQLQQKVRLLRFDGSYRWFYVRAAPLKDKRQNIVHWIGTNMDFHDQHLAELNSARQQETAASEAKYRTLANSSPQIVFAVTRTRGVIFCNTQWTSYSGQTEAEACGLGFMDFVHPEDISKCRLPSFGADSGTATNVPTTVPPESRPEPRRADSGSSASDVSSETERLVTSPGDDSPASIRLPQARLSKLAGAGIIKVTKDADGRPSYSTEVRLRSKDGDYRWHLVRILLAASVLNDPTEEETWYGTCTDINDHKLLEQRLKETMDAKSRFLSNMSHEIRTPLNGITGMVNFLIDSSLTSEQLEHVNIIRHSTEGLRNLIDDILDLSKVEAGMITLSLSWFHVRSLIEEVNDLMSAMAINKGLELNHVVEDDVPSMLKGDRFRIRQILLNVVGNAIKFTSQGEVFVRCRIADPPDSTDVGEHEQMLQFEVIDSGSGFTEKEAEFLFKRFSQIDGSTTRQQGGTGLGLAISMQLAELHGGKMRASSVPGKGSTFIFTIKFQLPFEDNFPPPVESSPGSALPSRNSPTHLPLEAKPGIDVARKLTSAFDSSTQQQGVRSPSSVHTSETSHNSPALSTGSSAPSIHTNQTSNRSERSSASSYIPEPSLATAPALNLNPPPEGRHTRQISDDSRNSSSEASISTAQPNTRQVSPIRGILPPLYSILVVCPLEYSRLATVRHIEATLPGSIPHQITARASIEECQEMLGGDDPVIFTHVILVLHEPEENIDFMNRVFRSNAHSSAAVLIISDLVQKREIMKTAPDYDYDKLFRESRLAFIFKPLKPSKFSVYFDPQKERAISSDRNQDSAQAVAVTQKAVFDDLKKRLGNKGHRVLLVEDNQINQTVLLKFLRKVQIDVETVLDGVQCTEKVFGKPHGYYSIILCDLHMPNKDGYQTCKEIRRWEKQYHHPHLPIIALSANVLGDVYAKCVEAGFNSYVTKPVDFKVLSDVMTKFLDPEIVRGRPHEFMTPRLAHT